MDNKTYLKKGYIPTIGIECHVQLKTNTKLFSSISNDATTAEPNTLISHICLGLPGALPFLNSEAVTLASRAAFALATRPEKFSKFDRKHYFYPDLPKGYQITQFDLPIIAGGHVDITINETKKRINITRAHLEEDAGKSTHPAGTEYSLVDLNRAGTPLLEIVSEPDICSATEAKSYTKELYLLMRYADVTNGDLYHGNMRFDVNVSVSKTKTELGTRTETKNLNSFKNVEKAVAYEIDRQIEQLEKGYIITQETRGWDEAKQKTFSQRSKEEAHDYRYFPEPDIPPIELNDAYIDGIKKTMPTLPNDLREKLRFAGVAKDVVETIIGTVEISRTIEHVVAQEDNKPAVRRIANWLAGELQALFADNKIAANEIKLTPDHLIELNGLVEKNTISSSAAKSVLETLVVNGGNALQVAKEKNLIQESDEIQLKKIIVDVLGQNPEAVNDIRAGQEKAFGFLVGQVMKQTKGRANPGLVNKILRKEI